MPLDIFDQIDTGKRRDVFDDIGEEVSDTIPQERSSFDTPLSVAQESEYRRWKAVAAPNDSGEDYDLRGAFLAGAKPDQNGHWPDTFKKPNHPTFSNESIYARARPEIAGKWNGNEFVPPAYVPAELQQVEEQAAIEHGGGFQVPDWLKQVVPQALKLPAKVAIAGGAMQTGRLHWPTDEEVSMPFVSPEQMKMAMPYAYVADKAREMFPESKTAQIAAGVTGGMTDAMSGFTTPENLATLPFAPAGKIAQRAIAGTFLGQAISGTPEQWEAFNNAPELADKIRIATSMGLGYALPALGAAATLRKPGPKIVEPVKTTQEAATSGEVPSTAPGPSEVLEAVESRPDLARIDPRRQQSDQLPQTLPKAETLPVPRSPEPSDLPNQSRSQPESISPPVEEARPKDASVPETVVTLGNGDTFTVKPGKSRTGRNVFFVQETGGPLRQVNSLGDAMSSIRTSARARRTAIASEAPSVLEHTENQIAAPVIPKTPIQPGIEAALAEIQRRNASEASRAQPVTLGISSEEAAPFRQPLPETSLRKPEEPRPESTATSTRNATTFAEPTGISKAAILEERGSRNLPPIERQKQIDFGESLERANKIAENDPFAPKRLVDELADNPRALNPEDTPLIIRRVQEAKAEFDRFTDEVNRATTDEARGVASERLEKARLEYDKVIETAQFATSKTGAGLNSLKMLVNDDYSLAHMESRTRAIANEGKPLTPRQANLVKSLHERLAVADAKIAAFEGGQSFANALKQERPKTGFSFADFMNRQEAAAEQRILDRRGKLYADPLGVTQVAHLVDEAIIGAAHITRGATKFADWSQVMITKFGEGIKPYLQGLFAKSKQIADNAARGKLTPQEREARGLAADKKRILSATEIMRVRTEARDTSPLRPKREPRMDREKADLLYEREKARKDYREMLLVEKLKNQNVLQKAGRYTAEGLRSVRSLKFSFDLSALLQQGGWETFGHPFAQAKRVKPMLEAMKSERDQFRVMEEIRNMPEWKDGEFKRAGIEFTDTDTVELTKREEIHASTIAEKVPGVKMSARGFATLLNLTRAQRYVAMRDSLFKGGLFHKGGALTPDEMKILGNFVNVSTGRGHLSVFQPANRLLNAVFAAPRLRVSNFQLMLGQPIWHKLGKGSWRIRQMMIKEMARTYAGIGLAVYAASQIPGVEVELDPRSTDFGQIRIGDLRIHPFSRLGSTTVLTARLLTDESKTRSGKIRSLKEDDDPFSDNALTLTGRYLRGGLTPVIAGTVNAKTRETITGEPTTPLQEIATAPLPLSTGNLTDALKAEGVPAKVAAGIISVAGTSVSYQEKQSKAQKKAYRRRLEARDKAILSGDINEIWRQYRQGKIKEFLTGK